MRKVVLMMLLMLSVTALAADSLTVEQPKTSWLKRVVESFSEQDTAFVEPQHYNWAVMLQTITTYDYYRLSTTGEDRQSISFAPPQNVKLGPYFGWRWLFLGYTVDLRKLDFFKGSKFEVDASIYSARFGADIFYRRTVNDYEIRRVNLGEDVDTSPLKGIPFDGLRVSITGVNLYYIFNHRRFSYPAAFAQSSCQKISCGSWMAGLGYLNHNISFDYERLESLFKQHLGQEVALDSGLMFNKVKYRNLSASVGYAYNWVFARNWLLCSSLSVALAYKSSFSEEETEGNKGFDFGNFNVDGIGRFGLVWNNTRWYAGTSFIVRAYNYHKSRFAANNIFGDLNIYVGLNFGPRSAYKKVKKNKT